jgi:hypothetical protein
MHDFDKSPDESMLGIECAEREGSFDEMSPSPEENTTPDRECKTPDEAPRVTGNESEISTYTDSSARILTIPGAVLRLPDAKRDLQTEVVSTATRADESADDFFGAPPRPTCEPYSVISTPVAIDVAESSIEACESDFAAHPADDAGEYTAAVEYTAPQPISNEPHPIAFSDDPESESEEYERFLEEQSRKPEPTRSKRRPALDEDADPTSFKVDAIDKSVKLVEARMLYEIESMKAEHRMLGYTFSMDVLKKDRTDRKMRRMISKRMSLFSKAIKRERADAKRYYTASLDKYAGNPDKRAKNTAAIESVLARLDYALKEREKIDERLVHLYGEGVPTGDARKEIKVAEKAAKHAYKAQLKLAKRVARMHAPTELKEKIFELMNERVKLLSDIERNTYLLSKKRYTGADKRNVKRQNRAMKRTARQKEDDIYFFIKKAQKQDESHVDGAHRLGWLVLAVLIALGIGVLYWLAKYYWRLF